MDRQIPSLQRKYRRTVYFAFTVATVCWAGTAFAQGAGGPQLADADRDAAWVLQAKGVASSLGLEGENATKLADAYTASRKSLLEAIEKLPDTGGGQGRFEAYRKVADEERGKLKTALAGFLTAEQADKAVASLGTYSRQWDRMVHTLAGFNLEEEKLNKALDLVAGYVAESDAAMRGVTAQGDWQALRTKAQELKSGLDTALGDVLAEDQLASWKEATTFRGGRTRGGGGSGEGPGGRRGADGASQG
jgi:hypothetical protein